MAIFGLPSEILTDIFIRLPPKTLSKLRFVNKSWFQFISSPDFARAHLKDSKQDHGVIFITSDFTPILGQFSIASLMRNSYSINIVNSDHHPKTRSQVFLWNSCNGLVCITSDPTNPSLDTILWNPCTGKYKELGPLDTSDENVINYTFGFGYDESSDDYKVVVLCYIGDDGDDNGDKNYHYEVKINSLKRNRWETSHQEFKGRVSDLGKIASGKIHWLLRYGRRDIVSFDFGSDIFGIVEQPNYGSTGYYSMSMGVLEGRICLLRYDTSTHANLWIMKEYGVIESWTKDASISADGISYYFSPCSKLPNHEILFNYLESFAVYNPEDDSFRLTGISRYIGAEPAIYAPSLVSPVDTEGDDEENEAGDA